MGSHPDNIRRPLQVFQDAARLVALTKSRQHRNLFLPQAVNYAYLSRFTRKGRRGGVRTDVLLAGDDFCRANACVASKPAYFDEVMAQNTRENRRRWGLALKTFPGLPSPMLTPGGDDMSDGEDDGTAEEYVASPPFRDPVQRRSSPDAGTAHFPASHAAIVATIASPESSVPDGRTSSLVATLAPTQISRIPTQTHPTIIPAAASMLILNRTPDSVSNVGQDQGANRNTSPQPGNRLFNSSSEVAPAANGGTNDLICSLPPAPLLPPTPSTAPHVVTPGGRHPDAKAAFGQGLAWAPVNLPNAAKTPAATRRPSNRPVPIDPTTSPRVNCTSRSRKRDGAPSPPAVIPSAHLPDSAISTDIEEPRSRETKLRQGLTLKELGDQQNKDNDTICKLKRRVLDLEHEAATLRHVKARTTSTLRWLDHHPERAVEILREARRKLALTGPDEEEDEGEGEPAPRKRLRMEAVVIHVRARGATGSTARSVGRAG